MADSPKTFGDLLKATRIAHGYSLRKFANLVDISPTYLSQVEQGKVESPPTAERVRTMAQLLGQNPARWIAIAGRMPEDLAKIIKQDPEEMPALLRAAEGMTAEDLRDLIEEAKQKRQDNQARKQSE